VKDALYKYYDGDIKDSVLLEGAVKGLTNSLNDPYTVFMNKTEYTDFNAQMDSSFSGVGLQVEAKDNNIVVVTPIDDTPAKKAGILAKDIIQKVNGKDVSGKDLDGAVALMKGKEGTEVTITLYREGKGSFDLKLKRQKITTDTVKSEMLSDGIGYIQLTMFGNDTADSFNKKLKDLITNKKMKSLILDLRGNPGGSLEECVKITSNFVKKGDTVVYTVDKNKSKIVDKSLGGLALGMKTVVLVDGGSASASEVFSGALKDYKAATFVGEKTFGKGIVQQLFPASDGSAMKITIAKYYSPSGINIQKKGIEPDVVVKYPDDLKTKVYDRKTDPQFQKALEIIKASSNK
jgi:carboxyl-terminal processing protease